MDFPTRASAVALLVATLSASAGAQGRLSRPQGMFELGVAGPALLVQDANGSELSLGVAPVVGAAATWSLGPRLRSVLGVRFSTAGLNGSDDGASWSAGRSSIASVNIGVLQSVGGRFSYSLHVGPTLLFGPDDVTPFAEATSPLHWGGGIGAGWRVMASRSLDATVSLDAFMIGGASIADPIQEPGWVQRVTIGLRYAR